MVGQPNGAQRFKFGQPLRLRQLRFGTFLGGAARVGASVDLSFFLNDVGCPPGPGGRGVLKNSRKFPVFTLSL